MKRYQFRLDPVLRVRRLEEEAARGELVAAMAAIAVREQELVTLTGAYENSLVPSKVQGCAEFLREQSTRSAFAAAVLGQRRRVQQASEHAAGTRAEWTEAAARVGALERLDERQRREHQARTQKEEELTADELVVSRHGRSDR